VVIALNVAEVGEDVDDAEETVATLFGVGAGDFVLAFIGVGGVDREGKVQRWSGGRGRPG
jgi:hypothetical protein